MAGEGAWLCFGVRRIGECRAPEELGSCPGNRQLGREGGSEEFDSEGWRGDPLGFHSLPPRQASQPLGCSRGADPTERIGDSEMGVRLL